MGLELAAFGQPWSGLAGVADWGQVPSTIPVIIFSLVYHDIAPGNSRSIAPSPPWLCWLVPPRNGPNT